MASMEVGMLLSAPALARVETSWCNGGGAESEHVPEYRTSPS